MITWPINGAAMLDVSETVDGLGEACAAFPVSRMLSGTTPIPLKTTESVAGPAIVVGRKAMDSVQLAFAAKVVGTAEHVPPGAVVKGPVKAISSRPIMKLSRSWPTSRPAQRLDCQRSPRKKTGREELRRAQAGSVCQQWRGFRRHPQQLPSAN